MAGIDVELELTASCEQCGGTLEVETSVNGLAIRVDVTPCDTCLTEKHEEGHRAGYDEGHDHGHAEGRSEGYDAGHADGCKQNSNWIEPA